MTTPLTRHSLCISSKHDAASDSVRQLQSDVSKDSSLTHRKTRNSMTVYRKAPPLTKSQMYCDTSIILEALEHVFKDGHPSLYPKTADGRDYRAMIRGFASYWTDVRIRRRCLPGVKLTSTATIVSSNDRSHPAFGMEDTVWCRQGESYRPQA